MKVGVNDEGAILVLDHGFAASKFSGKPWVKGIKFSADETFNGSFRDVTPPARATELLNEAREALSEQPTPPPKPSENQDNQEKPFVNLDGRDDILVDRMVEGLRKRRLMK